MVEVRRKKRIAAFILVLALLLTTITPDTIALAAFNGSVDVTIDTTSERAAISPYIYGGNWEFNNAKLTAKRFGGNRATGYNWENNYSNAGCDWNHSSDTLLLSNGNIPQDKWSEPGKVVTNFHDQNLSAGELYSLVTLQAAGYVAADANGTVGEGEVAPSARWKEVRFKKDAPLSLTPDKTDSYVYMDEFVNFLVNKYGKASTSTGIKGYAMDNETALWSTTAHPRLHPKQPTCAEIIDKNINLAKAVKSVDPSAETFGLVAFGFSELKDYQSAPDWSTVRGDHNWFLDYYLESMKKASDNEGKRLIDVLDLHWYPEAMGGGERVCYTKDTTNIESNKARLQAPRTLWDPTYQEDSWIARYFRYKLPIIPTLQNSIEKYNPGTKLAISEYTYGADNHITGGIAQADVLGVYGKYGVYFASVWGGGSYTAAGFNIYTNYDGKGSKYGNTKVKAETSDIENSSVYASVDENDDSKLHIIMINKNYDSPMTVNFNLTGNKNYTSGRVWAFDKGSSNIYEKTPIQNISGNKFSYMVPALTVCHIVLDSNGIPIIYGDCNNDGKVDVLDYALFKKGLLDPENANNKCMDLNLDGAVNAIDLSIMKMYLLGKIDKLPYLTDKQNQPPVAAFTLSPEAGLVGDAIAFDATASKDTDGQIYDYSWDFGDGTEGSGMKTTHKYKAAGTYNAKLIVTDNGGLTSSMVNTVSITAGAEDKSKINFEDGTVNGFDTNGTSSTVSTTTDRAFKGTQSLEWKISSTVGGKAEIKLNSNKVVLAPGSTMTFRVWVPSDAPIKSIQPYIMPHDSSWLTSEWNSSWISYDNIKKGDWNECTVTLPSTTNTSLTEQQFGIQIETTAQGSFTVYVDSIDW